MKKTKITTKPEISEVQILKGRLARALADYDNLRKRVEEEKSNWIKFATQKLVQNLLPIMDTFEMAQTHLKDSGLAIAISQLKEILKEEGLEEIKPNTRDIFDENLMEAIVAIPTENLEEENKISEIISSGWKFVDGMVIRHAKVKVFKVEKAS